MRQNQSQCRHQLSFFSPLHSMRCWRSLLPTGESRKLTTWHASSHLSQDLKYIIWLINHNYTRQEILSAFKYLFLDILVTTDLNWIWMGMGWPNLVHSWFNNKTSLTVTLRESFTRVHFQFPRLLLFVCWWKFFFIRAEVHWFRQCAGYWLVSNIVNRIYSQVYVLEAAKNKSPWGSAKQVKYFTAYINI